MAAASGAVPSSARASLTSRSRPAASPGPSALRSETGTYTVFVLQTITQALPSNSPATGGPGIQGTARVGETLTCVMGLV